MLKYTDLLEASEELSLLLNEDVRYDGSLRCFYVEKSPIEKIAYLTEEDFEDYGLGKSYEMMKEKIDLYDSNPNAQLNVKMRGYTISGNKDKVKAIAAFLKSKGFD